MLLTICMKRTATALSACSLLFGLGCAMPYDEPPAEILQPTEGLREGFVGLTETQARALARSRNVPFRVVQRDGKDLAVTFDFRRGRVNAEVRQNVVVAYSVEGEQSKPAAKPGAKMWSSPIRLKENKANPQLNPTQRVKRCQSWAPAVLILVA